MTLRPLSATQRASLENAVQAFERDLELNEVAQAYLAGRGIDLSSARRYRLGYVGTVLPGYEGMMGRICIPSLTTTHPVSVRFRRTDSQDPKILGVSGETTRLWNLRAIYEADDCIGITEGEIDGISLELCRLPASGVTGVSNWKRHHARLFFGFRKVLIFGDGDDAGTKFTNQVYESLAGETNPVKVPMPAGQDVNSMLVNDREGLEALIEEYSR